MTNDRRNDAALAACNADVLQKKGPGRWSIGAIDRALLERYPKRDALEWDRTGLLVGDPAQEVTGVAIALDPTVRAVREANAAGANVLLTHHPAFREAPSRIMPLESGEMGPGSVVWESVREGVALMNFHTTLDVSADAAHVLPSMLGLEFVRIVDVITEDGRGFGQLCMTSEAESPMSLRNLAARCTSVFGRPPRVWGDFSHEMHSIVTCTGSSGDLTERCVSQGCDCLVCGEVRYHSALAAAQAGLHIVELGHDVSELPLCAVLAQALRIVGFPEDRITILNQSTNWQTPEAIRK